jgi:hypothetical protein
MLVLDAEVNDASQDAVHGPRRSRDGNNDTHATFAMPASPW